MKAINVTLLLLFVLASQLYAQIYIDLSKDKKSIESIDVNKEPTVIINNMLPDPNHSYTITIKETTREIPSFSNSELASSPCDATDPNTIKFNTAYNNLMRVDNESGVKDLVKKLEDEIKLLDLATYDDCIAKGNKLIENTQEVRNLNFKIEPNQTIVITISRTSPDKEPVTWVKTYNTSEKTPWKIMYGFTFVPNFLSKVDNYYSKATDATNQSYTVTKFNNNSNGHWENISPTIMFQYAPSSIKSNGGKDIQFGLIGGLSLNFSKETGIANVLFGPSIIIAQNISISTGFIFTQKSLLKGKYNEGDVINENLDFDQLHDKKFMLENFISIAFRFDKNPFSGKDEAQKD